MPPIDDKTRLTHMSEASRKALKFTKGFTRSRLDEDETLTLALIKLLEIVGEAAAQISGETKTRYPQIPWRKISGMRNQLIHGYSILNLDILWQTIIDDLPPLVEQLQKIIDDAEEQQKFF